MTSEEIAVVGCLVAKANPRPRVYYWLPAPPGATELCLDEFGQMAVHAETFALLTGEVVGMARVYDTAEESVSDLRQAVEKYRAAKPEVK